MMNRMSMPLGLTRTLLKREEEKSFLQRQKGGGDQVPGRILKQWSSCASLQLSSTDKNHTSELLHSAMQYKHWDGTLMVSGYKLDAEVMARSGISDTLL